MKIKIVSSKYPSMWYSDKIGEIYSVTGKLNHNKMYRLYKELQDESLFIHESDCRPLKSAEPRKRAPNSQMAAALWKELNRRDRISHRMPEKTNWVPVTKQRLNAAVAALRH